MAEKESGAPVPSDLQYAQQAWPDVEKDHAAVISYLDKYVGDVFATLQRLGHDDDTLVLFASDNGAHLEGGHQPAFFNSTGGLKGHKRSLFEGGVRTPTLARWPKQITAGRVSDHPWAFWDVLPTFAELAGVTDMPKDLAGASIVSDLLGRPATAAPERFLYFTWPGTGVPPASGAPEAPGDDVLEYKKGSGYAVRVGDWKGIVPYCADKTTLRPSAQDALQLYHLPSDPFETTDVAATNPSVVAKLRGQVLGKNLTCRCYQCSLRADTLSSESRAFVV